MAGCLTWAHFIGRRIWRTKQWTIADWFSVCVILAVLIVLPPYMLFPMWGKQDNSQGPSRAEIEKSLLSGP
jgi:hypothetical protein